MTIREASHAGSWYSSGKSKLSSELDGWLSQVTTTNDLKELPVPGARIIIAPHAGYAYSGPAAAWAYKSLDLSNCKRIFLLGPSHALYLPGCALSKHTHYATPLGDLVVDRDTVKELAATGKFDTMTTEADENEHSLEMHLPYIYKMLSLSFPSASSFPPLVPVLVGNTSSSAERTYGAILAPYLRDPSSVFVISSDFCHWGSRFSYTYYLPENGEGYDLKRRDAAPKAPRICDSIGKLDRLSMDAIEGGKHEEFLQNLRETGNTVCGRHPIGVVMAAVEVLEKEGNIGEGGRFKFVRYERSSDAVEVGDSSVSYASAYAVL